MAKPATPALNESHALYANIVECLPFVEESGNEAVDLVGAANYTPAGGTEDVDYTWEASSEGGRAFKCLSGSRLNAISSVAPASDTAYADGTILAVVKMHAAGGGYFIALQSVLAGTHNQARLWIDGEETYGLYFDWESSSGSGDAGEGTPENWPEDTWIPVVFRWKDSTNTYTMSAKHPTSGQITISDTDAAFGGITRYADSGKTWRLGSGATGDEDFSITFFAFWDTAATDEQVTELLNDPYGAITPPESGYTTPFVKLARLSSTGVSFHRTLKSGETGGWAVTYWPTGTPASAVTLTQAGVSAPSEDTRQILAATGLTPNTEYTYSATEGGESLEEGATATFRTFGGGRIALVSDDHSGDAWSGSAFGNGRDADRTALLSALNTHTPAAIVHGGDWHKVNHEYLSTDADFGAFWQFIETLWDGIFRKYPIFAITGNHDWTGRDKYGDDSGDYWQLEATRAWKTYLCNPATNIEETEAEWAATDEQGVEEWATDPNEPPFENCWTFVDGPMQVWGVDVYRYMATGDATAARFQLGESQEAWLKAGIAASTATWKVVVTHNPTGGRHATNASDEAYGRGGIGVAEESDYDWYDLWQWFEANGVDIVCTGHDHVAAVGKMARTPGLPLLSMSSPFSPAALTDGYARGYNTDGSTLNDTEETYYDADLLALFGQKRKGFWMLEAKPQSLMASFVALYEDDDADPLVTLGSSIYTLSIGKSTGGQTTSRSRIGGLGRRGRLRIS